ncbi:hypothetical protein Aperf_G00000105858 [Anoplocephala perfoliata]
MLTAKLFLPILLLSVEVIWANSPPLIKNEPYVKAIYDLVKNANSPAFEKYSLDIFKPLNGPFYQHLSLSSDPRSRHLVENGFVEKKKYDGEIALFPPIGKDKVIIINGKEWTTANVIDMVELMEALLLVYVEDDQKELILDDEEISMDSSLNVKALNSAERIEFAEFQRPRAFLAFFVDVYRALLETTNFCTEKSRQMVSDDDFAPKDVPERCAIFFTSYDHVLATYTEVVCKYLTALKTRDVDHICPDLCLPRADPLWQTTIEGRHSIDVCGQIQNAMPGTCRLYGRGIYDHEFICQCITSAYQWSTAPGLMVTGQFPQCEPKDVLFEKLAAGASKVLNCSKKELDYFCHVDGTSTCYITVSRVAFEGKNETVTKIALWPNCICKEGHAGDRCDRRLSVCEDALPIPEEELEGLKSEVPGVPNVITANWLCEGYLPDANCVPDYSPTGGKYKYRCECAKDSERDWSFGDLDNCRLHSAYQAVSSEELQLCPSGYAGDKCDMTINAWSANLFALNNLCLPHVGQSRPKNRSAYFEAPFSPGKKVNSVEFATYVMQSLRNPASQRALSFFLLHRIEAESNLLKAANDDLCSGGLLGIYSESPFLRPVIMLREAQFAVPCSPSPHFSDADGMLRQLKETADLKCSTIAFPLLANNPHRLSALNLGFTTDCLTHSFNLELDMNLITFLSEQSKNETDSKGDQYRVVLRLAWVTTGLVSPKTPTNRRRLLVADQLPRSLTVRVARRVVSLPDPSFHGGHAAKLGHRLRYSIDITDKLPLRTPNLHRARNVEIEITWVHAPLEDYGGPLLDSVGKGVISPAINSLVNLPLVQVTLDRVEPIQQIVQGIANAKPGIPTNEESYQPQHPGALERGSLPPFTLDRVVGLYEYCISSERVISKEATSKMLRSKLSVQDELQCEDWFPASLNCPLTLSRIRIPVRSINCSHLQCFDLMSYLSASRIRPRWSCPVCSISTPFRDLRRDEFFEELLRNPALSESALIQVDADGNVREAKENIQLDAATDESPVKMDPCLTMTLHQQQHIHTPELIVIDSSDEEEEDVDNEGEEHMKVKEQTNGLGPPLPVVDAERGIIRVRSEAAIFNPPPQTASSRLPQTVRPSTIPAPVASGEIVDLTELSDESGEEASASGEVRSEAMTAISPPILPPSPASRVPFLVIPPEATVSTVPTPSSSSSLPTNLAPHIFTSSASVLGARYLLLSTTQAIPGAAGQSGSTFPVISRNVVTADTSTTMAMATAITSTAVPLASSNPLVSHGNIPASPNSSTSQDSTVEGSTNRSSRFKTTAASNTIVPMVPTVDSHQQPFSLRLRTSRTFSSPLPVTPSRSVARRGRGRGKRRRVHLGEEDFSGSLSTASSSTGAPSEEVSFEDDDEEDFEENEDDSDEEWTPSRATLVDTTPNSARRRVPPSAAALLAASSRRRMTTGSTPPSDGSGSVKKT